MKLNHLLMAGTVLLTATTMSSFGHQALAATAGTSDTTGDVTFVQDTDGTNPVDPIDPDNPVQPIDPGHPTLGPLSIDYASNFHFGDQNKISSKDEVYYAAFDKVKGETEGSTVDKPNWVQVTDKRGSNAGWKLQVQQLGQMNTKSDGSGQELKGAALGMTNTATATTSDNTATAPTTPDSIALIPGDGTILGAAQDVMVAQADQGMGTWVDRFGDATTGAQSISLAVPGASAKVAGAQYTTTLTWTLSDTPA